jgi:hypothetical protein
MKTEMKTCETCETEMDHWHEDEEGVPFCSPCFKEEGHQCDGCHWDDCVFCNEEEEEEEEGKKMCEFCEEYGDTPRLATIRRCIGGWVTGNAYDHLCEVCDKRGDEEMKEWAKAEACDTCQRVPDPHRAYHTEGGFFCKACLEAQPRKEEEEAPLEEEEIVRRMWESVVKTCPLFSTLTFEEYFAGFKRGQEEEEEEETE